MVKWTRCLTSASKTALLGLFAHGLVLSACGGASESARSPSDARADSSDPEPADANASESPEEPESDREAEEAESDREAEKPSASQPLAADDANPSTANDAAPAPGAARSKPATDKTAAARLEAELDKRRKAARARAAAEADAEDEDSSSGSSAETSEADTPTYDGPDPCRAQSFSVARVREACATGGRLAAKRVMKDAITRAIAMSQRLACTDCHENQRDYTLKPNAVADLERWLEGVPSDDGPSDAP